MTRRPAHGADSSDSLAAADTSDDRQRTRSRFRLDLQTTGTESGVLVILTGDLDVETSGRLVAALAGVSGMHREVDIDLSGITFLDVAGARTLVQVRDQVLASGGRLSVMGLDEQRLPAARVLDLRRHLEGDAPGSPENG